jgi:hypothetical protein
VVHGETFGTLVANISEETFFATVAELWHVAAGASDGTGLAFFSGQIVVGHTLGGAIVFDAFSERFHEIVSISAGITLGGGGSVARVAIWVACNTGFFDETFGFDASLDAFAVLGIVWLFALVAFSSGNTSGAFLATFLACLRYLIIVIGARAADTLGQ